MAMFNIRFSRTISEFHRYFGVSGDFTLQGTYIYDIIVKKKRARGKGKGTKRPILTKQNRERCDRILILFVWYWDCPIP